MLVELQIAKKKHELKKFSSLCYLIWKEH